MPPYPAHMLWHFLRNAIPRIHHGIHDPGEERQHYQQRDKDKRCKQLKYEGGFDVGIAGFGAVVVFIEEQGLLGSQYPLHRLHLGYSSIIIQSSLDATYSASIHSKMRGACIGQISPFSEFPPMA